MLRARVYLDRIGLHGLAGCFLPQPQAATTPTRGGMVVTGRAEDAAQHEAAQDWLRWDREHIIHGEGVLQPGGRPEPLMLVKGHGCTVETAAGRRLLDAYAGLVLCQLGYGCRPVLQAMTDAAGALAYSHLYAPHSHPWAARLARQLAVRAPGDLDQVFFTAGGAESVETAVKLSRLVHLTAGEPQRHRLIAFDGAYHGSSLGALALTGFAGRRAPYTPWLMPVHHAPQPDPLRFGGTGSSTVPAGPLLAPLEELLSRLGAREVAAVLIEPIQGVGGMVDPGAPFLQALAALCGRHGIHLILDEVMTGFGRTGSLFACQQAGIVPDFMALSKGITAGYAPLGAVMMRRRLAAAFPADARFVHGITYGGHPTACAAALAVLAELDERELVAAAQRHGDAVAAWGRTQVAELAVVRRVMGRGLMWGIQLELATHQQQPLGEGRLSALVARLALERDLIVGFSPERDVVQFAPPLTVDGPTLEEMLQRLAAALQELETLAGRGML